MIDRYVRGDIETNPPPCKYRITAPDVATPAWIGSTHSPRNAAVSPGRNRQPGAGVRRTGVRPVRTRDSRTSGGNRDFGLIQRRRANVSSVFCQLKVGDRDSSSRYAQAPSRLAIPNMPIRGICRVLTTIWEMGWSSRSTSRQPAAGERSRAIRQL